MTTRNPGPVLTLDARFLAPIWLSVALAASTVKDDSALYRAVHVEVHRTGLRLTSCNRYALLSAWVPALGHDHEDPVSVDETPKEVIVARDTHQRADSLMRHLLSLVPKDEADGEPIAVEVGVAEAEEVPIGSLVLDGLDGEVLAIDVPGRERLRVPTYEGEWLDWRKGMASFVQKSSRQVAFSPDNLSLLARLGALHHGASLGIRSGGPDRPVRVEIGDPPVTVEGVLMPIMWREGIDIEPAEGEPVAVSASCSCGMDVSGGKGAFAALVVAEWMRDHRGRGHDPSPGTRGPTP